MFPLVKQILILFGFTEHQFIIAMVCLVILLGCFLGGLLRSIVLAFSGPLKQHKLTQTMGFRLVLMSELFLLIFAFYYHTVLISTIDVSHVIYWIFTVLSAPILAFIGSQITFLIYQKKIEGNYLAYRKIQVALRERRKKAAESKEKAKKHAAKSRAANRFNPNRSL